MRSTHQLGLLHLLTDYYVRTFIPAAVVDEVDRGRAIGIDLPVLALGLQIPAAVVILDERLARIHAEALSPKLHGRKALFPGSRRLSNTSIVWDFDCRCEHAPAVLRQAGE